MKKIRILRISLTNEKISLDKKSEDYIHRFLGGRGVNRWVLLSELNKGVDAFGLDNKIAIGTGLLVGTSAPAACRLQIDTVSPFNNGVGSGNSGGFFAPKLRWAGYDHILIEGKAEKPVYILVNDRDVTILDAKDLWGKTTWETEDTIEKEHGKDVATLSIGPAGENLVRSAAIVSGKYRVAARCGMGAVMGSKNLKAISVEGTGQRRDIIPADPERFEKKAREMNERILKTEVGRGLKSGGTTLWLPFVNELSWNPVRNFQDDYVDPTRFKALHPENWSQVEMKSIKTCYACPVDCSHVFEITKGAYEGTETAGCEANAFWDFGPKLDVYDPSAVIKAYEICNRYGLDVDSVSGAISWAFECYEKGIINKNDTDGLELNWGNHKEVMILLKKIALREGFGNLLAEGCKRASEILGRNSERYCLHVKGQDLKEPCRTIKGWALGVMVSPRAGTHTRGCPETEVMRMSKEDGERYYGVPTAGDQLSYEGKAKLVVHFERLMSVIDSIGVCNLISEWNNPTLPGIEDYAELCSTYLGKEITPEQLTLTGERIMSLEKYFNQIHTNFGRMDDYPPERLMKEPVKTGPLKGERLDREKWGKMLDEYYELHKWDKKTGKIPKERLEELGILLDKNR